LEIEPSIKGKTLKNRERAIVLRKYLSALGRKFGDVFLI
jgi:hypothetical protein